MSFKNINIKTEVHDRVREIFPAKSFSESITTLLDEHIERIEHEKLNNKLDILLKLAEYERILKKFKITDPNVTSEQMEILKEMDKNVS